MTSALAPWPVLAIQRATCSNIWVLLWFSSAFSCVLRGVAFCLLLSSAKRISCTRQTMSYALPPYLRLLHYDGFSAHHDHVAHLRKRCSLFCTPLQSQTL